MDITSRQKILYIDDNGPARALVSRLLGGDYIVLEAGTPLSGIELARDTSPDLILIDINLPDLSGHEVATRLKSLLPQTPLVALTADTSPGARERALVAGCAGYITKPVDVDFFPEQIAAFLKGKHEVLLDEAGHSRAYLARLVERLEEKVRELTSVADRNAFLNEQNKRIIALLQRRQRLLEAAARVSRNITSILDLGQLLNDTVDVICEEYSFYYAGIFLLDPEGKWAFLKAGYGPAGEKMIADGHKLKVGGQSMIGSAISERSARIALNVGTEAVHFRNPYLPDTRSEMALPLIFKNKVFGALSVQSDQVQAFSDDDITALQTLADQVAVAINNAYLLQDLEAANQELLRTKTFEAIATATGEAIHWVGNKAAPVPASARRIREDLGDLLAMVHALLDAAAKDSYGENKLDEHPFWPVVQSSFDEAQESGLELETVSSELGEMPARRLRFRGSLESILEDLEIVEKSATTILNIKEDLIGPARKGDFKPVHLGELLQGTVSSMGLPEEVIEIQNDPSLPPVWGDAKQLDRVFANLVKNAWEALDGHPEPRIWICAARSEEPDFLQVQVADNGPGIPPDIADKIWVSFFTTKGDQGGTGLGLGACMEIVQQAGGKIWVESQPGDGAIFKILLPVAGGTV